jgi:tripartite-type tricarboxylate transporter receptor subunit TctC
LNKAIAQALHTNDVQEKLAGLGMGAVASSAVEAAKYIEDERVKWGKVVKAANIRAD